MIKLTKYGQKEEKIIATLAILAILSSLGILLFVSKLYGLILTTSDIIIFGFLLCFFRDPTRKADLTDFPKHQFLAPADGKVTEITEIDEPRLGGQAIKIGIFLSIFDVHINRSPCYGKVIEQTYKKGLFLNAMNPKSSTENEANEIIIEPERDELRQIPKKIIVKQIAGIIARRIVSELKVNDTVHAGQKFGMIKFGSRTELIVPAEPKPTIHIKVGQKVRAGNDVVLSY